MRKYRRQINLDDFDEFAPVRRTGHSLASTKKKKAKKKAATAAKVVKLPKQKDILDITEIYDFVKGPINVAHWAELSKVIRMIVVDMDTTLRDKSRRWGKETLAEMRAVTPVDSGNLRDSLAILTPNANTAINASVDVVDKKGPITVRVGIDEQRLLPPPTYKPSTKRFRKDPITHQITDEPVKVRIPPYNYAPFADSKIKQYHSEGYLGYDFLEKWQVIALNNLERIFN